MKKNYVSPMMVGERFVAEEYVAACGDSGKIYNFVCDAERGTLYYYPVSDGNIDGTHIEDGSEVKLGSYTPCSIKHKANATDDFFDGYVKDRMGKKTNVIVWRGPNNANGHATTNLNMETWELAKS